MVFLVEQVDETISGRIVQRGVQKATHANTAATMRSSDRLTLARHLDQTHDLACRIANPFRLRLGETEHVEIHHLA
ncbi:MAG: hypothetical protein ACR2L2_00750 [Acidobacteriota bacterium]